MPLQQLDRAAIKALYQELRESGYAKGKGPARGLSAKSVHNVALALTKALNDAVADGLIRANPAARLHTAPGEHERPEMLYWDDAELRRFLDAEPDPMWRVAAMTGLRRGELLGLRWTDVDLEGSRITVRQQFGRQGRQGLRFAPVKSRAGRRTLDIDPRTVETLRDHHRAQAEDRLLFGAGYADQDLVFARPDGTPHDPDVTTHRFEQAVGRVRVRPIRLHDLRHTHATLLLAAGVHPRVVQERLGHANVTITLQIYGHVMPGLQALAAAQLAAVMDGV